MADPVLQAPVGPAGPRFYFFSGKGGVGKTTLAAATAVWLARSGKRVLIASTDPAHNLSDVFGSKIGHEGATLEPNLRALEVDSSARWAEATGAAQSSSGSGKKLGRVQQALMDAMGMLGEAPGVDEFVSLELLLTTMASTDFDVVIFDTAPTGHTLRLLTLPGMLDGWIGKMLALRGMFSKLGKVFRRMVPRGQEEPPDVSENMLSARERIGLVRKLLSDPARTLFTLVSIPESMSVLETERTIQQLSAHGIPVSLVIANQVQPASSGCRHCQLRHVIHQRELLHLNSVLGSIPLQEVETRPFVIEGPDALAELGRELWTSPSSQKPFGRVFP